MPFEKFVPPKPAGPSPKATIRPTGLISFDAASVDQFNISKYSHAVLYFDKTRKLVGVELTSDGKKEGALKLTRRRRSVSVKAPSFFNQYGIVINQPSRFDVGKDDRSGMMVVNLKDVKRRRGRRAKRT